MASQEVRAALTAFVQARDWSQFHTPENLAKSISIEAAELLECFQWSEDADPSRLQEELADVLTYCPREAVLAALAARGDSLVREIVERWTPSLRCPHPPQMAST